MRNWLMVTVSAASLLTGASSAFAAGTWVPANPPTGGTSFTVFGINNSDVIAGQYINSSSMQEGVIGPFDGSSYTSFTDGGTGTEPRALNDKGYTDGFDVGTTDEWERTSSGTLTGITMSGTQLTGTAQGINKMGIFVGNYTNSSAVETGYEGKNALYKKDIKLHNTNSGFAGRAIDTAGDIGGWYYDSSGIQQGYLNMAGAKKPIDIDYPNAYYTVIEGMNNKGIVSGQWESTSGVINGFLYDVAKKKYTTLSAPGASFTQVWGINDSDVVAASADVSGVIESFVYCMKSTGCPSAAVHVAKVQHVSGKTPMPEQP